MTLHWHAPNRDYTAILAPDLFGDWMLITTSGSREGGAGRVRRAPVASHAEGVDALRRLRHRLRRAGYDLCGSAFTELPSLDPKDAEARAARTEALGRIFDLWDVDLPERAALLGVDARHMAPYLEGRPLPDDPRLLARSGHLLAIQKVLRLSYGRDVETLRAWLRRPCGRLGENSPLDVMRRSDADLAWLRQHLEREADMARACGAP